MTCKFFFRLENINAKMNNFIFSHGLGEIFIDPSDMKWCMSESSFFDKKKDVPLFKFLLNVASFLCRYHQRIDLQNIWNRTLIVDLNNIIKKLIFSFEKITSLCDDLFCTGDIVNNDQCIETFEKFLNNESFDFFDFGEIKEILNLIHMELMTFKKLLEELIMICQFFIIKKVKTQTSIIRKGKYSKLFSKNEIIGDFMQQLKKVVSKKIFYIKNFVFHI